MEAVSNSNAACDILSNRLITTGLGVVSGVVVGSACYKKEKKLPIPILVGILTAVVVDYGSALLVEQTVCKV